MSDEAGRLHSDDIRAIGDYVAGKLSASILSPPPSPPAGAITGGDLKSIQAVSPDIGALERLVRMLVSQSISGFKTEDQIIELVRGQLRLIGLRMDDDQIDQTRDDLRGSMKWHRWASKTWMAALGTVALGAVYAMMKKAGLPVPAP